MPTTIKKQPAVAAGRFPNVFVFPSRRIVDPGGNVLMVANLFNFKIDNDQVLVDHDLFLGTVVAPLLIANPPSGARLIGLASRSGSAEHNLQLSLRRAPKCSDFAVAVPFCRRSCEPVRLDSAVLR